MFKDLTVAQVMSSKIRTVTPNTSIWQASNKLRTLKIGALLVMDGDEVVGIFSERDVITKVIPKKCDLDKTKVSDVMTRKVLTMTPSMSVKDALYVTSMRHIRHVPIVDENGALKGMLGVRDLLYAMLNEIIADDHYLDVGEDEKTG